MPELHNQLFRGVWSEALKRALGITKQPGGLERFGETLTPTINMWERPEWAFLRTEQLWAKGTAQAAVVGEFSGMGIANPAGSAKVVVVERASGVNIVAGASVRLNLSTRAAMAATYGFANVIARDTRIPSQLLQIPEFWFGSDAAGLAPFFGLDQHNCPDTALRPFEVGLPVVLLPGFAIVAEGAAVNQGVTAYFAGYVRNALPTELI